MFREFAATLALSLASFAASAAGGAPGPSPAAPPITAATINDATSNGANDQSPSLIAKAETLLDRAHFSPGEIDALDGDNFHSAVRAFQETNSLAVTGNLDADTWNLLASKGIPTHLEEMARLAGLSYTGPLAELAEKFHMAESLLRRLNPLADFERAGTEILVADVPEMNLRPGRRAVEVVQPENDKAPIAATIVVDKPAHNVRAYDREGRLLGFYPATMGSEEKPAPSGVFNVRSVTWNPEYHYDPKFAWKEVKTNQKLTVRPGPNNPVGLVWIDLTAPSYGIHGTTQPEEIGKTELHGCVRLTNWGAVDLAAMVRPGTVAKFEDLDSPVAPPPVSVSQGRPPEARSQAP